MVSGGGSGAGDLGGTYGDRDTCVLTRVEEFKEDGDRGCLVKIKNKVFDSLLFEEFGKVGAESSRFRIDVESLVAKEEREFVCFKEFSVLSRFGRFHG